MCYDGIYVERRIICTPICVFSCCSYAQGSAEAWFHMGVMYLNGWGVKPSQRQALDCFTIAAQVGHVLAMYNLAIMHLNGRAGFATADAKAGCQSALALLKKIAEKGTWGSWVQHVRHSHIPDIRFRWILCTTIASFLEKCLSSTWVKCGMCGLLCFCFSV